jgi:hypothetical protein
MSSLLHGTHAMTARAEQAHSASPRSSKIKKLPINKRQRVMCAAIAQEKVEFKRTGGTTKSTFSAKLRYGSLAEISRTL